jgi:hypothetical protein
MRSATKIRTGLTAGEILQAFRDNLCCRLGRAEGFATKHDLYVALALTVRDQLFERTVDRMEGALRRCVFLEQSGKGREPFLN